MNKLVGSWQNVALKQKDVDARPCRPLRRCPGGRGQFGTTVTAQLQARLAVQRAATLNGLLGNPDLPIEQYPPYQQANAVLEQAQRDLDHTTLQAPIAGTATQVDNIQLGRFVTAGTPILSVIDDAAPWVDANPKETDLTNVRVGQKVALDVDAFPDIDFHGTVSSISPGTGAQFAILPPQSRSAIG